MEVFCKRIDIEFFRAVIPIQKLPDPFRQRVGLFPVCRINGSDQDLKSEGQSVQLSGKDVGGKIFFQMTEQTIRTGTCPVKSRSNVQG